MQQTQLEKKQKYLREEILEKNYDAQQFVMFLNTKMPIGDNLDLCSLEQLISVVRQYVDLKNKQSMISMVEKQPYSQCLQEQPKQNYPIKKFNRTVIFAKYSPPVSELEYEKSYKCIKINNKYQNIKQIKCQVSNPIRKNVGGIFGIGATSFLQFTVTTYGIGWSVGRRYSDFVWLRNLLIQNYPTHIIPPIPNKNASKRTQRHLTKRMRILQYFLNDIVSIVEFLNNKYVVGFLSIQDSKKFQSLKKEQHLAFGSIGSYENEEGVVWSKLSEENKAFMDEIEQFTPKAQAIYKAITRKGKQLQNLYTQEVNVLYEMGNHFADLHQNTRSILNKIPKTVGLAKMNQIYITMNNLMVQWGNIVRNQNDFLEKNFNTFFKYVRHQMNGYSEVLLKEQQLEQEFIKFKTVLERKKEKIFNLYDPTKWELPKNQKVSKEVVHDRIKAFETMLPQQNGQLQALRTKLYFYINNLHVNGGKNMERIAQRFSENFKQYSIKVKVNNQQLGQLWGEMANAFSGGNLKPRMLKQIPAFQGNGSEIIDD